MQSCPPKLFISWLFQEKTLYMIILFMKTVSNIIYKNVANICYQPNFI